MDEYKNDNRRSVLLEGMYNGMAGKIEEMRQSVRKELQYNSAQQVDAYEALTEEYHKGVQALLAELRYLSQQNSAIYDYGQRERLAVRDGLLESIQQKLDAAVEQMTKYVDAAVAHVQTSEPDIDVLARKVAERLASPAPEEGTETEAEAKSQTAEAFDESFDYDLLAEKIATGLPETDYDLLADKVVAAIPAPDENALVERIVAAIPVTDENALADRVAENITPTDYDLVAERVAAVLEETQIKLHDESVERIAVRVAELLRADDADIERVASDALAEAPAEEIAAASPAVNVAVAAPVIPEPPEGMMMRYKRSFIAKIIGSDEEVKGYYSDLKNALLGYQKANSQVSWTNDRFTLRGETVAKIGIRGRTLCLYVALDPNEFPESTYHQKFAGDTKMYEKTPMMVKIKSKVALRRAIRLVELLMEKNGAVAEETEPTDYAALYAYRSEEELLAEGLIKTAIVEKSDLDF